MSQISLYLNEETHARVAYAARREGLSLSKWAGKHLAAAAGPVSWPAGFFDLVGSISDDSFTEPEELPAEHDDLEVL